MTKDIVKNGDIYWFDSDGNSIVIAESGGVYFVDKNDKARYLTDDIRKIYDEKSEAYSINGMDIDEYIKSINKSAETTAVWTTTAKITESAVTSKSVQDTNAATSETDTEVPARVIYQTIYNAPEAEKTEVSKIEKSEKEETERQEFSEVTTVPEKYKAEEFQSSSEVHSQTAVTTVPQEKILYFTDNSTVENSEVNVTESTETTAVAVTENTAENVSASNNAQAFLLLAGVFGAAVAAAVLIKNSKRKTFPRTRTCLNYRQESVMRYVLTNRSARSRKSRKSEKSVLSPKLCRKLCRTKGFATTIFSRLRKTATAKLIALRT